MIGENQPFTIQLHFVLTEDKDALLYGQEGGFSIKIVKQHLIFELDGFCVFEQAACLKLNSQQICQTAVRYENGKVTIFLGGFPVSEQAATPKCIACNGNYIIGKDFTGGFTLIRVSLKALSNSEILRQSEYVAKPDENCGFQTDCSTQNYKDISKNRLPIWTVGFGARCNIMTACSVFTGTGGYRSTFKINTEKESTLLIKIYPGKSHKN